MSSMLQHSISGNNFVVSSQKCLYWEEEKALILSDLHLGKSGHFRKNGIPVPQNVFKEDMQRLFSLIQFYSPQKVVIAGDLFHSHSNKEHDFFARWRNDIPSLTIELVLGNHDILEDWYTSAGINVHKGRLEIKDFCFTHDVVDSGSVNEKYIISGHIHPSVIMKGAGKQSLNLPCFYFGKKYAVLPAFGGFTGTHPIRPLKGDTVFALAEKKVIKLQ
ncbi:MAG: ligase-associated DNA damage response endonuclease PdeM [Ferruginibacter sp.]